MHAVPEPGQRGRVSAGAAAEFVPWIEQKRLQAVEDRTEADLRLGRQDRLIPELRDLAARHPVRERFHGQLMEALARAGRLRPGKGGRADRRPGPSLLTITLVIEQRWRWHILADPDGNEFVSCCPSAAPHELIPRRSAA